jgi:low affinity Fe/Cu permease
MIALAIKLLTSRLAGPIGAGVSVLLALALAFIWVGKSAEIGALERSITALNAKVDQLTGDLTQCRANRITLEDATRRQNEAVAAAKAESAGRIAELATALDRSGREAARAHRNADRILAAQGTGDICGDADALILEEIGQ